MRHTDDEIRDLVQFHLEHGFYFLFIDWPDNPVPDYTWMDREGNIRFMDSMGLDHLKASSKLIENALRRLLSAPTPPDEVVAALEPYARAKLRELKETLREKVNS